MGERTKSRKNDSWVKSSSICNKSSRLTQNVLGGLENFFLNDPELQDKVASSYLSHKDVYEEAVRKATVTLKKLKQLEAQGRGGEDLYG